MCGSLFKPKTPKMPAAPVVAAPAPISVAKVMENGEVEDARLNERRRQAQMKGYKSTDLTGGTLGGNVDGAAGQLKKKLGE